MPDINIEWGAKPFKEAMDYFRNRLSLTTEHWDDLWKGMHTRAFTVAGAMEDDLLDDLRAAVDKAISEGETLESFRKRFDTIITNSGWVYNGGRNWRSRVIYDTNLRTSYQAGRYRQMTDPDVVALRPYWRYVHGESVHPRPEHLAWDGLILRHDDPWWDTHYPPNGWGCKCRVITLSERDMERLGKGSPDTAPEIERYSWMDREGTEHQVPIGIDPGWDYNVGKEWEKAA